MKTADSLPETLPPRESKSAFARRLGRGASYVTKLLGQERLVMDGAGRGARVRVAESLARIAATEGSRDDVKARHAQARAAATVRPETAPQGSPAVAALQEDPAGGLRALAGQQGALDFPDDASSAVTKARAQARDAKAAADIREMERDKMRGELIAREQVESAFRFVGGALAGLLDNLPGQYATLLAPVTDADDMEQRLAEMCDHLRSQYGDAIARQQREIRERAKG